MTSTVVVWVTGGVFRVTLPTEQADTLARAIRRSWHHPDELNELHLADGSRVTPNPAHIVAVEVR